MTVADLGFRLRHSAFARWYVRPSTWRAVEAELPWFLALVAGLALLIKWGMR